MKKLIGAALIAAFVTPAWSAELYIVQDVRTGKCSITDRRPTTTEVVVVGNGRDFTSFAAIRACNND
jgi:hypothetical protein